MYKSRSNFKAKDIDCRREISSAEQFSISTRIPSSFPTPRLPASGASSCSEFPGTLRPSWINESVNNEKYAEACCHLRHEYKRARTTEEGAGCESRTRRDVWATKHKVMHWGHTSEATKDCDNEDMRTKMNETYVHSTNAPNIVKKPRIV